MSLLCRLFSSSYMIYMSSFFFFSSRRRHTRWPRDWSSDVCSSDLDDETEALLVVASPVVFAHGAVERLRQMAAHPGRVVTRVLVPDADPASVSLWSAGWFARERVGVDSLRGHDLDFVRQRLRSEER